MVPYPYGAGNGWCGEAEASCSVPEIDGLLAGAGYRVRSSELRHVAQRLERLESAMVGAVADPTECLAAASEAVHCNPSDLAAWVDSMLSELDPNEPRHQLDCLPLPDTWIDPTCSPPVAQPISAAAQRMEEEEDSGIRLVHLLMSCAHSIQRGETGLARSLVEEMRALLARVSTGFGIGKVAVCFVDALSRRIYGAGAGGSAAEYEILYHHFYEASPYLKFAHFTANQAILEAFEGHDRVHVVDFSLMQGLQWPALIQALALRPGGPPALRLTGIGPPSPDGRDSLREVGLRLAELARSVGVPFTFRGVAAARLDDVRPWMLQVALGEAVAVNSVMQLHRLVNDPESAPGSAPVDSVLSWVTGLRPKIVTVVEQEADHNKPAFLDRFTEALFYYSTVFDSLEAGRAGGGGVHAFAEVYLQREISNIVCCEGAARVERHEPLGWWRLRLSQAGLRPVHLGSNAFKQARMLLTLFSGEGYCVGEVEGCLTLGWHNRPLIAASAWRANDDVAPSPAPDDILPNSLNNNGNIIFRESNGNGSDHNYYRSTYSSVSSQQESLQGM